MSGVLNYISADDGTQAYNQETQFNNQQNSVKQAKNVDAAIRSGVGTMLANGGPGGSGSGSSEGSSMPAPSSIYTPPLSGPAPMSQGPAPSSSGPSDLLTMADSAADKAGLPRSVVRGVAAQESSWNPNNAGGLMNILAPTAAAPGYGVAPLDFSRVNDPQTNLDFGAAYLAARGRAAGVTDWNDPAQMAVGLKAYNGGGDPNYVENVTRRMGMAPPTGATAGGAAAPDFGAAFPGAQPSPGFQAPSSLFSSDQQQGTDQFGNPTGPANFGNRMTPILSALAATPGGGQAALGILNGQSKYDFANIRRGDNYQRLAMQALGQGNTQMAQYYAKLGGVNLPDSVYQNSGQAKMLSVGALTAERLGGRDDPAWSQRFVSAFIQTGGNAGAAFQTAGTPTTNPHMTVQQVYDAATGTMQMLGIATRGSQAGTAAPITGPNGAPVSADVKPQMKMVPTKDAQGNTTYQMVPMAGPTAGQAAPVTGPGQQPLVSAPTPQTKLVPLLQADGTTKYTLVPMNGDQAGQATGVTGADGQQMTGAARQTSIDAKQRMFKATGMTDQDAAMAATGQTISPAALATYRRSRLNALSQDVGTMNLPPDQKTGLIDKEMDTNFPGWRQRLAGTPMGAPSAPTPSAPPAPGAIPPGTVPAQVDTPAPASAAPTAPNASAPPAGHPGARFSPKYNAWLEAVPGQPGQWTAVQ